MLSRIYIGASKVRAFAQRRFHVVPDEENEESVRSHKSRTRCCCACCGAPRAPFRKYKTFGQKAAHGEDIWIEWNSGCDRPKMWQVYGKLVGSELTTPNAKKESIGQVVIDDIAGFQYSFGA